MDPSKILLLGVKGTVVALDQETGIELWRQPLKAGMADNFVSLLSDTKRVYAHTKGELFCLDLLTGSILWQDGLKGLGYGIASLAVAGLSAPTSAIVAEIAERQRSNSAGADTS